MYMHIYVQVILSGTLNGSLLCMVKFVKASEVVREQVPRANGQAQLQNTISKRRAQSTHVRAYRG